MNRTLGKWIVHQGNGSIFSLDRPMITCKRLMGSLMQLNVLRVLGISFCLCSSPVESLQFLFYHCPRANGILSWVQSLMFTVSPLRPSLLVTFLWFFGRGTASRSSVFNLPRQCCYVVSSVRVMVWLF